MSRHAGGGFPGDPCGYPCSIKSGRPPVEKVLHMKTKLTVLAAAAAITFLSVGVGGVASAATVAPGAVDSTYMHDNAQTNLAEITIGKIAETRAQSADTKALAEKTMSDHEAAFAKLKAVAKTVGYTLPDAPNASQQADAAKLKSVSSDQFDLTYAQIQVAGP